MTDNQEPKIFSGKSRNILAEIAFWGLVLFGLYSVKTCYFNKPDKETLPAALPSTIPAAIPVAPNDSSFKR
jgi:hypothetical protein